MSKIKTTPEMNAEIIGILRMFPLDDRNCHYYYAAARIEELEAKVAAKDKAYGELLKAAAQVNVVARATASIRQYTYSDTSGLYAAIEFISAIADAHAQAPAEMKEQVPLRGEGEEEEA